MERSYFKQIKEAFCEDFIPRLSLETKRGGNAEWQRIKCPLCSDESGSASIAKKSGYLRCHQCDRKMDLFEWYAELHGGTAWEACQKLAELFGIELVKIRKRKGRAPKDMTPELLELSIQNLWEEEWAAPLRRFMIERKFDDQKILARFGVGALSSALTIAQFWPSGQLKNRYRRFHPHGGARMWGWSSSTDSPGGIWPHFPLREDDKILLLEGEWDTLTGWIPMRLYKQNWVCFCSTGGATNPIMASTVPDDWKGREVHICYDNDVFQGLDLNKYVAPDPKKHIELIRRRDNLVHRVAKILQLVGCDVYLRQIPINPLDHWGGDFRDWVNQGGKDLDDLECFPLKEVLGAEKEEQVRELSFDQLFDSKNAGALCSFTAQVGSVEEELSIVPEVTAIECPKGQFKFCNHCGVTTTFPSQIIYWKERPEDLAGCLAELDFNKHAFAEVIRKPRMCDQASLRHLEWQSGARWMASPEPTEE